MPDALETVDELLYALFKKDEDLFFQMLAFANDNVYTDLSDNCDQILEHFVSLQSMYIDGKDLNTYFEYLN